MHEIRNPKSEIQRKPKFQNPNASKSRPFDLRQRSFQFALAVLRVSMKLPALPESTAVRTQLTRSAASVGANIEEADNALSKADTRKSFVIARKEAAEARYWLRLVRELWGSTPGVSDALAESDELVRILATIVRKLSG